MAVDGLEHRQDRDPGRHPAQPVGTQHLADPFRDGRIQSRRLRHLTSITQ
jgi:hypothetical protein